MTALSGRAALVTGAARGLGLAIATALSRAGAAVTLADLRDAEGQAAAAALSSAGGQARFSRLDVTRAADWQAALPVGGVQILVNCAGITDRRGLLECDLESWRRLFAVNVEGALLGLKAVVPAMRAGGGGTVINIASAAAIGGHSFGAYSTTKWALRGLGRSAALELAPFGIRVNTVCPGLFMTEINRDQPYLAALTAQVPLARAGRSEEVGALVCYLGSDAAGYVTGQDFVIDGGLTAGWRVPSSTG